MHTHTRQANDLSNKNILVGGTYHDTSKSAAYRKKQKKISLRQQQKNFLPMNLQMLLSAISVRKPMLQQAPYMPTLRIKTICLNMSFRL